jgi:hypothetical protein
MLLVFLWILLGMIASMITHTNEMLESRNIFLAGDDL